MKTRACKLRRPSQAFGLVECLVYIAALLVIGGLAMAAFYRAWEYSKFLHRASGDIIRALEVGERWRADIRATRGAPRVAAAPGETWLYLPQAAGEVRYRFASNAVFRLDNRAVNPPPLLVRVKECRFSPEVRGQLTAWRWDLELLSTRRVVRVKPIFTFQAVPTAPTAP